MFIILTIDVESYTGDYEREVLAEGKGLEYIVGVCRDYGVKATFFVEALGATRWGTDPLRRICSLLLGAGQDVQLHLHPVVAAIDGFEDHEDVLWKHDARTQEMLLRKGCTILEQCGVDRPVAFRAGDFAANADTLAAMACAGLHIGSNRDLDQKSSTRSRLNDVFPIRNDVSREGPVTDVPVTACRSPFARLDGPYRHMEISAMGWMEMRHALIRMQRMGYACAGILTHPREFFRYAGDRPVAVTKNCRRLERLLQFVNSRGDMRAVSLPECAQQAALPSTSPPEICLNPLYSLVRLHEQGMYRIKIRLEKRE
jgi:hypothetical protein